MLGNEQDCSCNFWVARTRHAEQEVAHGDATGLRRCRVNRNNMVYHARSPQLMTSVFAFGRHVRRGLIRGVAVAAMLVMYAAASIGTMATSAIGVAGLSSLALSTTATPASAWRRRRRRYWGGYYGGGYYRRRRYGWGYPYRRRRRRRGVNFYLTF